MPDPRRVSTSAAYAVISGDDRRVGSAGAYTVLSGDDRRVSTTGAYVVSRQSGRTVSTSGAYVIWPVCGDAPGLSVGEISSDSAKFAVEPLSEYLEVWFGLFDSDGVLISEVSSTGSDRFYYTLSLLDVSTDYVGRAKVRRDCGWSPWAQVEFTTTAEFVGGDELGCPPYARPWLQNPDANPPNRDGLGFYTPLPGEPISGTTEIVLRDSSNGQDWDIYISDDQGTTYTKIVSNLTYSGDTDGDGLYLYKFNLDTTTYSDGLDFRLKASSTLDEDEYESLTFPIDNAGDIEWWLHRGGDPLDGRFGKLWAQEKTGGPFNVFGVPGGTIWARARDGGIAAIGGQDWSFYADRNVPQCLGADVTLRFYIWSGEGGLFGLQGRDDTEGFDVGIGFFGDGDDNDTQVGLVVGANNFVTYPLGCCDDILTSGTAKVSVYGREVDTDQFAVVGSIASVITVDSGVTLEEIIPIRKMSFKSVLPSRWISQTVKNQFPLNLWRDGDHPGDDPMSIKYSCCRRYEVYSLRARVEVDPADHKRVRIRSRLDGPGVDPPDTGYWYSDEWIEAPTEWQCGAVGLVSRQFAQHVYNGKQEGDGARVFLSLSTYPLVETCAGSIDICPDNPPTWTPCPDCTVDPPTLSVEQLLSTSVSLRSSTISPPELTHVASKWRLYLASDLVNPIRETDWVCGDSRIRYTWNNLTSETEYASTVEHMGWDEDEGTCCKREGDPLTFTPPAPSGTPSGPPPVGGCPPPVPPETTYDGGSCPPPDTDYDECSGPGATTYERSCE